MPAKTTADREREAQRHGGFALDGNNAALSHTKGRAGDAQQALNTNWQSALCVTSVYDAMAQLQQENEALREELKVAKQTHEIFAVRAIQAEQAREPERVNVCDKHEQEIRLLRREKLQLERLGEQQRVTLETRVREAEAACHLQITKYQEKYSLDPNAAKRVALSVQTLRDALEKVVEEKEELAIRFSQLTKLYSELQLEHSKTVTALESKIAGLKAQRGVQRVVSVLSRWSTSNLERAWRIWATRTQIDRVQMEERSVASETQRRLQIHVSRLLSSRLGEMTSRSALTRARKIFDRWRDYSHTRQRNGRIIKTMALSRSQSTARSAIASWRAISRAEASRRAGSHTILALLSRHKCQRALRMWYYRTQVEFQMIQANREKSLMRYDIANLTSELDKVRQELEQTHCEKHQLISSYSDNRQTADELIKRKLQMELAMKKKVGRFLRKQSDRQLLLCVLLRWREAVVLLRSLKKRVLFAQARVLQRRLRQGVAQWRFSIGENRKYAAVVHRLKNLTVVRCFNSWKQAASDASAQKCILRQAVFKMQHQQLAMYFAQWKDFQSHKREVKRKLAWLVTWAKKRQLVQGFSQWRSHLRSLVMLRAQKQVEELRQLLESEHETQKQQLALLIKSFYQWRQRTKTHTDRVRLLSKYAARLRNSALQRAMRSWLMFCENRKQARDIVRRWVHRSYTGRLTVALAQWKQYARSKTYSTTTEQQYQLYERRIEAMKQQVTCYGMMHEEHHQRFDFEQQHQEQAFQGVLAQLNSANNRQERLSRLIDTLCSGRTREVTLRKVLRSWQAVVSVLRAKRHLVREFKAKTLSANLQAVFITWKKRWMRQKRVLATVANLKRLYDSYLLSVTWCCWVELRRHQKRIKDFARLCISRANTCCLAEIVHGWRRIARMSRLLRTSVAHAMHRSATGQLRQAFSSWLTHVRALATAEKKAKRKQLLDDLRDTISIKWSLSVSRTVFVSWKSITTLERAQHSGAKRLRAMYELLLLQRCMSTWQNSISKQVALENWLSRWMSKTVIRKQERAFRVWKSAVLRTQMEDLRALRALYQQEKTTAQQYMEELLLQKTTSDTASEKLVKVEAAHALIYQELECTIRLTCLSKVLGAWKMRVQERQHLGRVLLSFSRRRQRWWVEFYIGVWREFVQNCHILRRKAEKQGQQLLKRRQRLCFRCWHSMARAKGALKRRVSLLRARFDRAQKQNIIAVWRSFTTRAYAVYAGADLIDNVVRTVSMRTRFSQWIETTRSQKRHEQLLTERQLRVDEFVECARERLYNQVITAWRQLVHNRQSRLKIAESRFHLKCLQTKRDGLDWWKANLLLLFRQRQHLEHAMRVIRSGVYRSSLRTWAKNVHVVMVASLTHENLQIARQQAHTDQKLRATASDLDRLKSALANTSAALDETKSQLADARSQWTLKEMTSMKAAARFTALQKLVLRRFVAQTVARAFRLWRERCVAAEKQHKAIRVLAVATLRQRRLCAFLRWKGDCKLARKRQRFLDAMKTRALRCHIQRWKRIVGRRAAAKLFLARRLLTYLAGPQRLSWGFRQWKLMTAAKSATDHVDALVQDASRWSTEVVIARRRLLLAKWSWSSYFHRLRQMRAFILRCQTITVVATKMDHEERLRLLEATHARESDAQEKRAAQELILSAQKAQANACNCETIVTGPSMRAVKALLHRISQAIVLHELFASVSGTFGQFLHGCSAILFFFDPSSNELWTQREPDQMIQVPVSIGITGCTLSCGSMLEVDNMLEDPRFHPMVDQLVLGELRASEAQSALPLAPGASSARSRGSAGSVIGLLSVPLLSNDGAVYGVLQVAVPTSSLSSTQARTNKLHAQLFARTCAIIVEQLLTELLRNCRDRVRSRTPDRFAKLFKQSKNWRKYYASLERKSSAVQNQLKAVSEERLALVEKNNDAQTEISMMRNKLESFQSTKGEFAKQVEQWKRKLLKLKAQLDEKEALVQQKTIELQTVSNDFQRYRKRQQSRELDAALFVSYDRKGRDKRAEQTKDSEFSDSGQLTMLRADCTAVKNQLVRAESDNLLLVRALEMARQNDGQLPAGIANEVARITIRVTKDS